MIQQFSIDPAMGSNADWMSAAVVPGAKLLPTITKGPELAPLMAIPPALSRMVDCPLAGLRAVIKRSSSGRRLFAGRERGAFGAVGGAADTTGLFLFGFELVDAERWTPRQQQMISMAILCGNILGDKILALLPL